MPKAASRKDDTKAKKRAKKDPNAPKRPTGAYIFFCSDKRATIKKEQPELSASDILKELGALWKETSDEDKKPYYAQAEKDKERFQKEDAAYKKKSKSADEDKDEDDDDEDKDDVASD